MDKHKGAVHFLAGKNYLRKLSNPSSAHSLVVNFANSCKRPGWEVDIGDSDIDDLIYFSGFDKGIWVEFDTYKTRLTLMVAGVTVGKARIFHCQEALLLATLEAWMESSVVEASCDDTEEAKKTIAAKSVIGVLAASIRGNWAEEVVSRLNHMTNLIEKYYPKRLDWLRWLNDKDNRWTTSEDGRHMRDSWSKVGPYIESCPKSYFDLVGLDVEELGSCWESHIDK